MTCWKEDDVWIVVEVEDRARLDLYPVGITVHFQIGRFGDTHFSEHILTALWQMDEKGERTENSDLNDE